MHNSNRINQKQNTLEHEIYDDIDSLNMPPYDNGLDPNTTYKIEKIDKNYKKFNSIIAAKAIGNGALIIFLAYLIFNPKQDISEAINNRATEIMNSLSQEISNLIPDEKLIAIFASLFDRVNQIIDKIGVLGLALASRSIHFILSTVSNAKRSLLMKVEIEQLKDKIYSGSKKI